MSTTQIIFLRLANVVAEINLQLEVRSRELSCPAHPYIIFAAVLISDERERERKIESFERPRVAPKPQLCAGWVFLIVHMSAQAVALSIRAIVEFNVWHMQIKQRQQRLNSMSLQILWVLKNEFEA